MTEEIETEEFELPEVGTYPLDWKSLRKGQDIPADQVQAIMGVSPSHPRFPFALLELRDFIQSASAQGGAPLSVCCRKSGLHINTDSEAISYHDSGAKRNQRGIFRQLHMLAKAVDVSALTNDEKNRHVRALCLWGAKAAALKKASKGIEGPSGQ